MDKPPKVSGAKQNRTEQKRVLHLQPHMGPEFGLQRGGLPGGEFNVDAA